MPLLRVRFTIRRIMLAVAIAALFLVAYKEGRKCAPYVLLTDGTATYIQWEDGSTRCVHDEAPIPMKCERYTLITLVKWSDGSTTAYLPWR
jgi:hypothetical protein